MERRQNGAWRGATGIGMAGGFGTGKSHMLGYLAEVARQQGFVVSRVVVSKETPLSHPGHVLAAALRDAALPDRPDDPIAACVFALRERPEALDALEIAVSTPDAGFAPIFAACLFLLRRASTPPEMLRRIARLWAGTKVSTPAIRKALIAAGAGRMFSLKPLPAAELTNQLTRFVPLLFRAAGYAGWCILLDEIELIGRYTPLQRALSYAWLAAWLGLDGERPLPGHRHRLCHHRRLRDRGYQRPPGQREAAGKADAEGTRRRGRTGGGRASVISSARCCSTACCPPRWPTWPPATTRCSGCTALPTTGPRRRCHRRSEPVRGRMRQYIKGWITQWDLLRLDGGDVVLVSGSIASNYTEDATLAEPRALDDEEA